MKFSQILYSTFQFQLSNSNFTWYLILDFWWIFADVSQTTAGNLNTLRNAREDRKRRIAPEPPVDNNVDKNRQTFSVQWKERRSVQVRTDHKTTVSLQDLMYAIEEKFGWDFVIDMKCQIDILQHNWIRIEIPRRRKRFDYDRETRRFRHSGLRFQRETISSSDWGRHCRVLVIHMLVNKFRPK